MVRIFLNVESELKGDVPLQFHLKSGLIPLEFLNPRLRCFGSVREGDVVLDDGTEKEATEIKR